MLRSRLIHPEINRVLAEAGHHAVILIADGHYPASSKKGPNSTVVSLNLMPGLVTCGQVLEALLSAVPIDGIRTMEPEKSGPYALAEEPPVWAEYRTIVGAAGLEVPLQPTEKWAFYDAVMSADHVLTIQTGDLQRFANLLLSVGVRLDV